jgi:hypothetical protein
MRITILLVIAVALFLPFLSCNNSGGPATFCDTVCIKDTIRFTDDGNPMHPYVYLSPNNCNADTIAWSYDGMDVSRKTDVAGLVGKTVKLNKDYMTAYFKDTSYAMLVFNDCETGRGYQIKVPYSKTERLAIRTSGINKFDKKFAIADGLIAYTDRGNIFIEEPTTGKTAQMTFGKAIEKIEYDRIHDTFDSISVTPSHVWVKLKMDNEWKELQKDITLK